MEEAGSPDGSWREALAAFFTHLLIFCSVFLSLPITSRKDNLVQQSLHGSHTQSPFSLQQMRTGSESQWISTLKPVCCVNLVES